MWVESEIMPFIQIYSDYFFREDLKDKYSLLKSSVALEILNVVYRRLISDPEVKKIEDIPKEDKIFFWEKVIPYYEQKEKRIWAAKAAYTISLITSTK